MASKLCRDGGIRPLRVREFWWREIVLGEQMFGERGEQRVPTLITCHVMSSCG